MKITYCKKWSQFYKKPLEIWTKERARKAHEAREMYGVFFGDVEDPYCYLTINNDYIGISFLDSLLRVYLRHKFSEVEEGVVFLKSVVYREFKGGGDDLAKADIYRFWSDGRLYIEKQDRINDETRVAEDEGLDVSCNYEDYPEFGSYDAFVQHNRPMPK